MSSCWKCGSNLPAGQVECDPYCAGNNQQFAALKQALRLMEEGQRDLHKVLNRLITEQKRREALKNLPPDFEI